MTFHLLYSVIIAWGVLIYAQPLSTRYTSPSDTLPPTPKLPPAIQTGYVNTDVNVSIWYSIFGKSLQISKEPKKPPIVFLHGGFGNSDYFADQIRDLQHDGSTLISLDSRSQGRSTGLNANISYSLMADDVTKVLDFLEISKAIIVGWSDGGIIGLTLAMGSPSRVERLFAFAAQYSYNNTNATASDSPVFQQYLARAKEEYQELSPMPQSFDVLYEKLNAMFSVLPDWTQRDFAAIPTPDKDNTAPLIWIVDAADDEVVDLDTPRTLHSWVS